MRSLAARICAPVVVFCAIAAPARAESAPTVTILGIDGAAVVGSSVAVVADVEGDPAPTVAYQWLRCDGRDAKRCRAIEGATDVSYTPGAADVGAPLRVRVTATNDLGTASARSEATDPVAGAPEPTPTPEPTATPEPTPDPEPTPSPAPSFTSGGPGPGPAVSGSPELPGLRYLEPFPVVRVRGSLVAGGARVALFRVKGPRSSEVEIRCRGKRCPFVRKARRPGRVRKLERFLGAGTVIVVRVTAPERIGKYARLRVRSGRAPARRDACLLPGSPRPAECPPAR